MSYRVEYAAICFTGKERVNNEDNFYVDGRFLPEKNSGLPGLIEGTFLSGDRAMAAVFDGLGGCEAGERAAFLAAKTMGTLLNSKAEKEVAEADTHSLINSMCEELNRAVCGSQANATPLSRGTTVVSALFRNGKVAAWNVGDSMSFLIREGRIKSVSKQHVADYGFAFGKPPITQCLGIPVDEMVIEPYISEFPAREGDIILLTSDGVTDVLSEEEILTLVERGETLGETTKKIASVVKLRGAPDNTTAVLCRVQI